MRSGPVQYPTRWPSMGQGEQRSRTTATPIKKVSLLEALRVGLVPASTIMLRGAYLPHLMISHGADRLPLALM